MKKPQPEVSVIIPAYNSAQYIGETIESVLQQTYKGYEIIVVDDGSTDNTKEVLKPYISNESITYCWQENKGASAARNKGINEARGKYIALLDGDDLWYPEKLKMQLEILEKYPNFAMVHGDSSIIDPTGKLLRYSASSKRQSKNGIVFEEFFRSDICIVMLSTAIIRKTIFFDVGFFDENLKIRQDYDFFLRLFWKHPVYLIDLPLAKRRMLTNSLVRRTSEYIADDEYILKKFINEHNDYFNQHSELLRYKWGSFYMTSALKLWHAGDYSLSHRYFKKVITTSLKGLIYYLITLFPEDLLRSFRNAKRALLLARKGYN